MSNIKGVDIKTINFNRVLNFYILGLQPAKNNNSMTNNPKASPFHGFIIRLGYKGLSVRRTNKVENLNLETMSQSLSKLNFHAIFHLKKTMNA